VSEVEKTTPQEARRIGDETAEVFLDQLRDGGGDLVNISSVAGRTACVCPSQRSMSWHEPGWSSPWASAGWSRAWSSPSDEGAH
jgi:hypothetical protein